MTFRRPGHDRATAALGSLSAAGAGVAGFGLGILFAARVPALALPAIAGGVVAHLFGMVGMRRLHSADSYEPSELERMGYLACWFILLGLLAYAVLEWVR